MVVEAAGAAELAVLQDSHARVREAADLTFLGIMGGDLYDGALRDLFGAEHSELYADDGFRRGTVR